MPQDRATIFQVVQIGVEGTATPGTAVTATRQLSALSIEPSAKLDIQTFRPMGKKFTTVTALSKEWTEASLTGVGSYNELQYPLASVINRVAPTVGTAEANGTAYVWAFSPATSRADTPATYTVEQGSDVKAQKFSYGLVTEFGIAFSRDGVELSGSMLGQRLDDDATLSNGGTAASYDIIPVLATQVTYYLGGTTPASLNTATAADRVLSFDWKIGSRYGPVWTLDARKTSWAATVETEPSLEMELMVEADDDGMGYLALARTGETRFIRCEAIGGTIPNTSLPYMLRLDNAIKVSDVGEYSDEDGVYAISYTLAAVSAAAWGGTATLVTLRNAEAAL